MPDLPLPLDRFADVLKHNTAVVMRPDFQDQLAVLSREPGVTVADLARTLGAHLSAQDQRTVAYRAWRRAWEDARPDLADGWKTRVLARGIRPARGVIDEWFSPEAELYHLSSSLWRFSGSWDGWMTAFERWRSTTPDAATVVNQPLGWHTTVLLWRLNHHPALIGAVHRSAVGLDLELPLHRWAAPRAGYLTGVPHELGLRQRSPNAWTLLGVAVERGAGTTSDRGLWAATALGLIAMGANLDAPAWHGDRTVAQALAQWADTQPAPEGIPRGFDDQQVQALAILGRRVLLDQAAQLGIGSPAVGPTPSPRRRL